MLQLGVIYALLSGVANGLFSAPMKLIPRWKWENIWLVFIVTSCIAMPLAMTVVPAGDLLAVLATLPRSAVIAALFFGFAWGFGSILFGQSVHRLGVSLANSLVIGLSSAAGSVLPLIVTGGLRLETKQVVLLTGVAIFITGVALCAKAGLIREADAAVRPSLGGYLCALGSGIMSGIFNVGYSLALPITRQGEALGLGTFTSTNLIWLLMLGAGSIPNLVFCAWLLHRNRSTAFYLERPQWKTWGYSLLMGLLWGCSVFLYGLATPLLGNIGPAIGWPLSLAAGLLIANAMGFWLGEWRRAAPAAVRYMRCGIGVLLLAIVVCSVSTQF